MRPHPSSLMFPSQLLQSQHAAEPPSHLSTEDIPVADPMYSPFQPTDADGQYMSAYTPDRNFAVVANDLINATLGRVPDGHSVIEPDSVLDESGRLYHGYKSGKYFLPNDAVRRLRFSGRITLR